MKEIPLTQGQVALVDDEDYEFLNQWKWHAQKGLNTYYATRTINRKITKGEWKCESMKMHRAILKPPDNMVVDHINHNGLDNRKENLRIVTHRENHWNRLHQRKYIGVQLIDGGYHAVIRINGMRKYIGRFKTQEDAHSAYMDEAFKLII